MQKEKAPSTAATMQGAYIEQNHKENTTKSPAGQGLLQAATALECLGIELGRGKPGSWWACWWRTWSKRAQTPCSRSG